MRRRVDPALQAIADEAFDRSWRFLGRDAAMADADPNFLKEQLADLVWLLARRGGMNATSIANTAIRILRDQHSSRQIRDGHQAARQSPREAAAKLDSRSAV